MDIAAQQVDGSSFTAPGWGGILIALDNEVYLMSPVFHCPTNPCNTFLPQTLKSFLGFKKVIIDTGKKLFLLDGNDNKHHIPTLMQNELNFVDISIIMINKEHRFEPLMSSCEVDNDFYDPVINSMESNAATIAITDQPSMQAAIKLDGVLPARALAIIAEYYVYLFPCHSLQDEAIRKWNIIFNSPYQPIRMSQKIVAQQSKKPLDKLKPSTMSVLDCGNGDMYEPVVSQLSQISKQYYTPLQQYKRLHLCTQHASDGVLEMMVQKGTSNDLPSNIWPKMKHYNCNCYVCMISKPRLLPKGKLVDKTTMAPFTRIHLDFHFFSVTSIWGFTSSLAAVCSSTSYPFNFPTKNKSPPIAIVLFLLRTIRSMGHVDEDGALAKSSQFCSMIIDENCILETTGGRNSTNNGQVEQVNQYDANMIRPALSTMNILMGDLLPKNMSIEMFWCCALQNTTMIHRRMYNWMHGDSRYFLVHKKRPSIKEFVPCGSIMTIVDPHKDKSPKLSRDRAKKGYFCAFGNNLCIH